ncbi:MAG: O-antigen ligase family protein [Bacteroidetes bacterium]|nr:O-antigen ligase family protein [Bacteroidota bacterium]MCB0842025.1 O-antigen ligase family protein [Bacteroidota bacterium]
MKLNPVNVAWLGMLIAVISLSISKALLSISTGIFVFAAVWQVFQQKDWQEIKQKPWIWGIVSLFVLSLIAVFYTDDLQAWGRDVRQKLPLLAIPISLALIPRFSKKQYLVLFYAFILAQSIVAVTSLVYYFLDFELINEAIKKNGNIDIIGSINHIYFGLLLAFSILLGAHLILQKKILFDSRERWVVLALTLINLVSLHILTSRTGLVSFYMVAVFLGLFFLVQKKAYVLGGVLLAGICLIPLASYYIFPSFKYRVDVTIWDVKQYFQKDQDLTEKSASLRLLAWETAWEIFTTHPILGVGIADLEPEMALQYEREQVRAKAFSRPTNPHNQYLEYLAGFGILGLLLLLWTLFYPIWYFSAQNSMLFYGFLVLFMSGMLFESLLERQIGMSFFVLFMMILTGYQSLSEYEPEN